MGREERQALLHEGSGSAVMSAYVEIIFDNSDDRFPTGKDELILRRTIGLKKDEYSLDKKSATKTDVYNLLESAGFSRSNPYYIVPQGRVTALTNMKDAERLNLLKEVAGTQVYESRRTESLKIMNETNNKRAKIDELLEYIKERLAELEEEKDELRGYQEKDRERRCLEYAFYHQEQEILAGKLDEIEDLRVNGQDENETGLEKFREGEKLIANLEEEIKQLNRQADLLKLEKRQLEEDRREKSKAQAKAELDVKNLTDGLSVTEQARTQHQRELTSVKQDIATREAELKKLLPKYNESKNKEANVRKDLDIAEAARNRLYNKQGRGTQFKTKAERDQFLKKEITDYTTALGEQKANRINADEEVHAVQAEIKSLEDEIAGLRKRFEGWGGSRQALFDEVTTAKDGLEKLNDERKLLRREEDKLESVVESARQDMHKAESSLSRTMDGGTSRGLATVRRLKREHNLAGALGTLAELFEVSEKYRLAAEQTAGNSLFHYVVDNAETAEFLSRKLYEEKGGRVTFMPLAQLKPKAAKLPNASDAISLISKLQFDKRVEKAMSQVFGKTVICPSLQVASQYARSHGCNAITSDGDTANKKGALTGGYMDPTKSRLQAVRAVNKWRDEWELKSREIDQVRRDAEKKDHEINGKLGELHKLDQELRRLDDSFDPLKQELRERSNHLARKRTQLESNMKRRDEVEKLLRDYGETISSLEAELASDFKKSLSADEERQLDQLNISVQELQQQWNELGKERRNLEGQKQFLEVELRENLRMKLDELNSEEIDNTTGSGSSNLKQSQKELKRAQKAAAAVEAKLQDIVSQIEEVETKVSGLQKEKNKREEEQNELARDIEKQKKRMEKSVARKALLVAQAAECAKNIRDLGVLPDEAFEKYSNIDSKQVSTSNHKICANLTLVRSLENSRKSMML
jgi:structural maintenance of chromosome 3 (chondroitin sulfate proteoglycan 6)